jgi:hypothetical protein
MKSTFRTNCIAISTKMPVLTKWLTVVMIAIALTGLHKTASAQTEPDKSTVTRTNADYPGGIDQFYSYILTNMKLDRTCVPGKKIYVQFVIDKDGKLCHAKVRGKELSPDMNDQLVKLFESAPKWIPAQQNGSVVKEHFVCPVMFMPKMDMIAKVDLPAVKQ